jgi:hypothetical protein
MMNISQYMMKFDAKIIPVLKKKQENNFGLVWS